jgi:predicted dehydrogenase
LNIGIVGLGYWGKIILRNLRELGYKNITICEQSEIDWHEIGERYRQITDYRELECDYVFVITPVSSHYDVCGHFLRQGCKVFCEKPLDTDLDKCNELYELGERNGASLFVDWLFTFNPAVNKIKSLIKNIGKPKSIIANRMNFGPVRSDVNARWDLASHDVSIGCYLLDETPTSCNWLDFKRNKESKQDDSTVGIIQFSDTSMQVSASWHYGMKNRMYIFEFDNTFIHWDDNTSTIMYGSEIIPVENYSPLHNSIEKFLAGHFDQRKLTLNITKCLLGRL